MEILGRKIALTICEDIWNDEDFWPERRYRRDPVHELVAAGAELIVNISASPWERGKENRRLAMLQRVARDERVPLVQVNIVGANDELIFDGHSVALNDRGEVVALGAGFAEDILLVDLENGSAAPSPPPAPRQTRRSSFSAPWCSGCAIMWPSAASSRWCWGFPGGIDSALVAVVAAEALGAENVWGVSLPSRHSSQHSSTTPPSSRVNSAFATTCCPSPIQCRRPKICSGRSFSSVSPT